MAESLEKSCNKILVKWQENPTLNDFEKKYVSSVSGLTRYSAVYGWGVDGRVVIPADWLPDGLNISKVSKKLFNFSKGV